MEVGGLSMHRNGGPWVSGVQVHVRGKGYDGGRPRGEGERTHAHTWGTAKNKKNKRTIKAGAEHSSGAAGQPWTIFVLSKSGSGTQC